jgi:hypothetical protein
VTWCQTFAEPEWRYNPRAWDSWYDDGYYFRRPTKSERWSWYERALVVGFSLMPPLCPGMNTLQEILRIVERYPPDWRRWCDGPENGGCACSGCVRTPPPIADPGHPFLNPEDRLTRADMQLYQDWAIPRRQP